MKKSTIVFLLLTIIFFAFIFFQANELKIVFKSFEQGVWYFLVLSLIFQVFFFASQSEVRRSLYRIIGIKENFLIMFKLTFLAMFVGTIIPFHIGGMTLFLAEAKAKGYSKSKALIASLTYFFFDYAGFFVTLILALFLLFKTGDLTRYQIIASGILLIFVAFLTISVFYILHRENRAVKFLEKISKLVPKKKRERWLPKSEIDLLAKEAIEAKHFFLNSKRRLWQPSLFAFFTQFSGIMVLLGCFLAYGIKFDFTILITVYAMAMLFLMIAVTPYGVGAVELAMTLTLTSFGKPWDEALLVTLTFRFFTFWVPMFMGYMSSRKLNFGSHKSELASLE